MELMKYRKGNGMRCESCVVLSRMIADCDHIISNVFFLE